jgi:hypothetical protein
MTKPGFFATAALSLLLASACETDPAHESGTPDERPTPKTETEATAQEADKQERQKALKTAGLCTPQAIRSTPEPDERFWHCRGEDWTGSTQLKDKLAELSADPDGYQAGCDKLWNDPLGTKIALCDDLEQ